MKKKDIKDYLVCIVADMNPDYILDTENGGNIRGMLKTIAGYMDTLEKDHYSLKDNVKYAIRVLEQ